MKNQKGITLVALVITIIVMLILAGVSLNAIVGENGILTRTQEAVIKNKIATYQEIISLEVAGAQMELPDNSLDFLNTVQTGVDSHEEFENSVYSIKNNSRLIITTKDEYVFVVQADSGEVAYIGTTEEVNSDLPTELVEADIKIEKSTSNWTKNPVRVSISCEKYPTHIIEYSYDLTTWSTYNGDLNVTFNTPIYVRLANDIGATDGCSVSTISNIDTKVPDVITDITVDESTITTKGFTVSLSAQDTDTVVDNASGLGQVIWYYKDANATDFNVYEIKVLHTLKDSTAGSTNVELLTETFDNLQATSGKYNVYAEIYDVAENLVKTSTIDISLKGITVGTHLVSSTTWTNSPVTVTLPTETGLTTKYSINDSTMASTTDYTVPFQVNENCDIYYYATDGTNILKAGTVEINNIDATAGSKDPIVSTALSQSGTPTTEAITTTITVQDTLSGFSHIDWYYKQTTATGDYTKVPMDSSDSNYAPMNQKEAGKTESLTINKTFSGLAQGEEYCFYAEVYDVAGNKVVSPEGGATSPLKIKTDQIMVSGIELSPTSQTLNIGGTATITATVNPSGAKIQAVTWNSSNPSVATVSGGTVTAVGPGTAVITAKSTDGSNKTSNACTITVNQPVSKVTVSPSTATVAVNATTTLTATIEPSNASNQTVTWSSDNTTVAIVSSTGVVTAKSAGTAVITATTADGGKTASCTVTVPTPYYGASNKGYSGEANTGTSYVGYYADINYDGTVDGIIYADLRFAVSGKWNPSTSISGYGSFSYTALSSTNSYYISSAKYNGSFGENYVIVPNTTNSNERFYIMALSNVDSAYHCWYDAAYSRLTQTVSTTGSDFGQGRTLTRTYITVWNNKTYGAQNDGNYSDIWGLSAVQACASNNWFVPSKSEWAAFGYNLGITKENYRAKGLSNFYWSSAVFSTGSAYTCNFDRGRIGSNTVDNSYCVRLSTTF